MRRKNVRLQQSLHETKSDSHFSTWFAFGCLYQRTKEELNNLSTTCGGVVSAKELAGRMAELLYAEASGGVLGGSESLPKVWGNPSEGDASTSKKKIHVRPHGRRTLSAKGREAISRAQKARWKKMRKAKRRTKVAHGQKNYWKTNFPTPELRSAEMLRRMKKSRKSRKAA